MRYFYELVDGTWFMLGEVWCRKLDARGYVVVVSGWQVPVGNGRFKVKSV
jgi:hypothetical protein